MGRHGLDQFTRCGKQASDTSRRGLGRKVRVKHTWNLLFGKFVEVVHLSLIRGAATVPEKEPLQTLAAFQLILEPELVVFVGEFEEVEQFSGGFHDGERGRLVVINNYWDAAY